MTKAILLNGSLENDITGERVRTAVPGQLQTQGWEVEHFSGCRGERGPNDCKDI